MKILKIKIIDSPNFKQNTTFELNNDHRINKKSIGFGSDDQISNKQLGNLIQLVFDLLNGKSINNHVNREVIEVFGLNIGECCKIQIRFSVNGVVYELTTQLMLNTDCQQIKYVIKDEILMYKDLKTNKTLKVKRHRYDSKYIFIDDISMLQFIGKIKPDLCISKFKVFSLNQETKYTQSYLINNLDQVVINLILPDIESIKCDYDGKWLIKYKGNDDVLTTFNSGLNGYISDKSINTLVMLSLVIDTLKNGGYLFVDNLETYLNPKLCEIIVNWFNSKTSNQYESVLIYATHDPKYLLADNLNYSIYKERGAIAFEKGKVKFNEQLDGKSKRLCEYLFNLLRSN